MASNNKWVAKRSKYLDWDDYFMGVALLSSYRSKDPNTQVGAVIVDENNIIRGTGYNGLPIGISDDTISWERNADHEYQTKYPYLVHAEQNALLNCRGNLEGSRIYVTLFPCSTCAKLLMQSGIKEIIYLQNLYQSEDDVIASKMLLDKLNIKIRQFSPKVKITY